jgi:hypothetical protein
MPLRLVEDDEQDDPLVVLEAMRSVGGNEGRRTLLERVLLPLYVERAPPLQHEVELFPLVRLLRVGSGAARTYMPTCRRSVS